MVPYCVTGILIGCCGAYIISKIWDVSFADNTILPSQGKMNLLIGGIVGGSFGLGICLSKIITGTYLE